MTTQKQFSTGDIVYLKNNAYYSMVISKVFGCFCECIWFDRNGCLHKEIIDHEVLCEEHEVVCD